MIKILSIVGARPQFVKAAVISKAIRDFNQKHSGLFEESILHTGQHFDYSMNDVFFEEMGIPDPKYNLEVSSLSHGAMTGLMIQKIEKVIENNPVDIVLLFGDTNSTLAGAIAAKKKEIKLAHVEAGLRSYNIKMAEEQNRLLTDRISDLLFCPSQDALRNLEKEGVVNSPYQQKAWFTGDVMIDALKFYGSLAEKKSSVLKQLNLIPKEYVLATVHRAENTNDPERLQSIFEALRKLATQTQVILPLHPRTRQKMVEWKIAAGEIQISEPVSYLDMIALQKHSEVVITDSGGIQKEAFAFEKTCITMRDETEWTELVETGANILTGASTEKILNAYESFKHPSKNFFVSKFYGDGDAGEIIIRLIAENIKESL